jgi:hypothetical protein
MRWALFVLTWTLACTARTSLERSAAGDALGGDGGSAVGDGAGSGDAGIPDPIPFDSVTPSEVAVGLPPTLVAAVASSPSWRARSPARVS